MRAFLEMTESHGIFFVYDFIFMTIFCICLVEISAILFRKEREREFCKKYHLKSLKDNQMLCGYFNGIAKNFQQQALSQALACKPLMELFACLYLVSFVLVFFFIIIIYGYQ